MKDLISRWSGLVFGALVVGASRARRAAPPQARPVAGPAAQAVDEGLFVEINGVDQWVTIRGLDRSNPVLLILGGPGAALSAMAPFFAPWEGDFTLVQWDQPGAGATYAKNGEAGTDPLTVDRLIATASPSRSSFGGVSLRTGSSSWAFPGGRSWPSRWSSGGRSCSRPTWAAARS